MEFRHSLINAEIELILKWSKDCVLTSKTFRQAKPAVPAQGGNPALLAVAAVNAPSDLKFSVTGCRLFFHVVTLPKEYENTLLEEFPLLICPTDYLYWLLKMKKIEDLTLNSTCQLFK